MLDLDRARAFIRSRHQAILATIKRDRRPQLSNVLYFLDDDGRLKISVTQTRAKTANLRRDPRASVLVLGPDFWQYVVIEGTCTFVEGQGVLAELRRYYQRVSGTHPDWEEYDAAMVRDQRLLLSISMDRAYGQLRD